MGQTPVTSLSEDGKLSKFHPNTTTLILEKSDVAIFPWTSLTSLPRLRHLEIHHCDVTNASSLEPLTVFNLTSNFTSVNLRWNAMERIDTALLSVFPSVEHLCLASNAISRIGGGSFLAVPKLAYLDLSHNPLGSALLSPAVLSHLDNLRELNLENCSIKTLHRQLLRDMKSLKYLYLSSNQLALVPLATLAAAPRLIFLHMAFNNISYIDSYFARLNKLQFLFLHNNGLEAIHPRALDGFDFLQQLVLNNNRLKYLPAGLEPALLQIPRLDAVSLVNVTWRCDCDLLWLVRLAHRAALTSSSQVPSLARCFLPGHLANTSLRDVTLEDLRCPKLAGCEENELSSVQCEWCPPFQKPRPGGMECACMEGYEFIARASPVCQACPAGYYKAGVGEGACVVCPSHSSTLTDGARSCVCDQGFTLTLTRRCQPCPLNTYKSKLGNHRCHPCPQGSHSPQGSNSLRHCQCRHGHGYFEEDVMKCVTDDVSDGQESWMSSVRPFQDTTTSTQLSGMDDTLRSIPIQTVQKNSVLVVGVVVGGVVMSTVVVVVVMVYLMWTGRVACACRSARLFPRGMETNHYPQEVKIDENLVWHGTEKPGTHIRRLRVGHVLGRGTFGQVHAGVLSTTHRDVKSAIPVAVKRLKDRASEEEGGVLQQELEVLLLVGPHPNIITLLASCLHHGSLYLILERAELGDLLTYLRQGKLRHEQYVSVGPDGCLREQQCRPVTEQADLMLFAWHLARGMNHLENLKCIHRDLAARNCLLTTGPVAKLSDFGLSRDVYENGYYLRQSKGRVPYKWLSPEALLWGQYSTKSDVWAYGILLWELATLGGAPYSSVPLHRMADRHRARYRLPQPPACPDTLYHVMRCCWHEDPRRRPTFRRLCDVMELFVQAASKTQYLALQNHGLPTTSADVTARSEGLSRECERSCPPPATPITTTTAGHSSHCNILSASPSRISPKMCPRQHLSSPATPVCSLQHSYSDPTRSVCCHRHATTATVSVSLHEHSSSTTISTCHHRHSSPCHQTTACVDQPSHILGQSSHSLGQSSHHLSLQRRQDAVPKDPKSLSHLSLSFKDIDAQDEDAIRTVESEEVLELEPMLQCLGWEWREGVEEEDGRDSMSPSLKDFWEQKDQGEVGGCNLDCSSEQNYTFGYYSASPYSGSIITPS